MVISAPSAWVAFVVLALPAAASDEADALLDFAADLVPADLDFVLEPDFAAEPDFVIELEGARALPPDFADALVFAALDLAGAPFVLDALFGEAARLLALPAVALEGAAERVVFVADFGPLLDDFVEDDFADAEPAALRLDDCPLAEDFEPVPPFELDAEALADFDFAAGFAEDFGDVFAADLVAVALDFAAAERADADDFAGDDLAGEDFAADDFREAPDPLASAARCDLALPDFAPPDFAVVDFDDVAFSDDDFADDDFADVDFAPPVFDAAELFDLAPPDFDAPDVDALPREDEPDVPPLDLAVAVPFDFADSADPPLSEASVASASTKRLNRLTFPALVFSWHKNEVPLASKTSKNSSHDTCSRLSSGSWKSRRSTPPAFLPRALPRVGSTIAGRPPLASAQARIASWSRVATAS